MIKWGEKMKEKTITVNDLMIQGVLNVLNGINDPLDFRFYIDPDGFLICGRIIEGKIEDSIENIISLRNKTTCKMCRETIDQWLMQGITKNVECTERNG